MKLNRTPNPLDRNARNGENVNWDKIEGAVKDVKNVVDDFIGTVSDEVINELIDNAQLNWKEFVDSYEDLPTDAQNGDTVLTRDDGKVYRFDGSEWVVIQQIDINAINEIEQRLDDKFTQKYEDVKTQLADKAQKNASFADALDKLQIINYLGNIQNVHPKVLYFKDGWNSWKFWMAYTPYPGANTAHENPCIAVSMDGINWGVPDGLTNPLFNQPSGGYNSDTHLVMKGNTMELWWRSYLTVDKKAIIYRRTSTNGTSWTEAEVMFDSSEYKDILSPAIIYEDGKYKMWGCLINQNGVVYNESTDGKTWSTSNEKILDIDLGNLRTWHIDVMKSSKGYEFVIQCYISALGQGNNESDIYYVVSNDNVTFSKPLKIISKSETKGHFADRGLYRASIVDVDGTYMVYYSGISQNNYRALTFSQGKDITKLYGFRNTGTNDLRAYNFEDEKGIRIPRVKVLPTGHYNYGTYLKAHPELRNVAKLYGTLRPHLSGGLELGYLYLNDAGDIASQKLPVVEGALRREGRNLSIYNNGAWRKLTDYRSTTIIKAPATINELDLTEVKNIVFRGTGLITINGFTGGVFFDETRLVIDSSNVTVEIPDNGKTVTPGRTKVTLDQTKVSMSVMPMATGRWRVF